MSTNKAIDDGDQRMHDMLDPKDRNPGAPDVMMVPTSSRHSALRQPAGNLIEQQQRGFGGERARHLQPLAFEQRQRAGERIGALEQAKPIENLAAGLRRLALGLAPGHRPRRPADSRTR